MSGDAEGPSGFTWLFEAVEEHLDGAQHQAAVELLCSSEPLGGLPQAYELAACIAGAFGEPSEAARAVAVVALRVVGRLPWEEISRSVNIESDDVHGGDEARSLFLQAVGRGGEPLETVDQLAPEFDAKRSVDDLPTDGNLWVFQGNPDRFDIDGMLAEVQQGVQGPWSWSVARYGDRMRPGDWMLLWRSGPEAGIYAVCRLFSYAEKHEEPDEFGDTSVGFAVREVLASPVARAELLQHPTLSKLPVITQPQGTNYLVPDELREDLWDVVGRHDGAVNDRNGTAGERCFTFNQGAGTADSDWTIEGSSYTFYKGVAGYKKLVAAGDGHFAWYHAKNHAGTTYSHFVGTGRIERVEDLGVLDIDDDDQGPVRRWKAVLVDYQRFPNPVPSSTFDPRPNSQHSINEISNDDLRRLRELGGLDTPARRLTVEMVRSQAEREGRQLSLPPAIYASVVAALNSGKHVILTGPPGTGKTSLAEAVGEAATRAGLATDHVLTTATSDWTTFETIGGLRPTQDQQLRFTDGQFLAAIRRNRWLVIDELNRANFDRAFGQFFTVLSGQAVTLPYNDPDTDRPIVLTRDTPPAGAGSEHVHVHPTWRIVATMNVFDKALLFEMSYALMRRFAFIEVPAPDDDVYKQLIARELTDAPDGIRSASRKVVTSLLPLRALKEMGPATFLDMARYATERLSIATIVDDELAYELFYAYMLPQFEGITDTEGEGLFRSAARIMPSRRDQLLRDLVSVLGLIGLQPASLGSDEEEFDVEPAALELG